MVKKTDYYAKITEIEKKILSITGLFTTAPLNTKVTEIENKIPDISNQVTNAATNTKTTKIESKIAIKMKINYDIKIMQIENKIADTSAFDTKLRKIDTKVTLSKTRQVHTEKS